MEKRARSIKYIAVLSITALIFLIGIMLGNHLASLRLTEIKQFQEKLTTQLIGLELRYELLKYKDVCNLTWQDIWEEKVDMGARMVALESRLGKTNPDILLQKEVYELVEIRTLLLLKDVKQKCNADINIILYFYTNKEKDLRGSYIVSEDQGYVLDALFNRYGDKINVFAFDINTDNPAINALKSNYGIEAAPSLVINEELYLGFSSISKIEKIIFEE